MRQMLFKVGLWGPALALGLVLGPSVPAEACSCLRQSVEDAVKAADAIFEGRVSAIDRGEGPVGPVPLRVRLSVVRHFQGEPGPQVEVRTAGNSAACGYPFEEGQSYLVYARRTPEGELTVSLCGRTQPMAEASEDLAVLGAGVTPVDVSPEEEEASADLEAEDDAPASPKEVPPGASGCASCAAAPGRPTGPGEAPPLLLLFALVGVVAYRAACR